ncbi:MAG: iron-sulfur cluster assembly accessory protein [Verrucomicrobiae bacterium]|nr:iron-sulfur cluster assembly accessory protein [Verrucomicrobiae bacterium]
MITVTENAFSQVRSMLSGKDGDLHRALRVYVEDGGCSGRQYNMKLDEPRPDDFVAEHDGARVVVDPASMVFLKDCQVDYQDTLADTGFKIHNPQAKRSCGCGKSFEA